MTCSFIGFLQRNGKIMLCENLNSSFYILHLIFSSPCDWCWKQGLRTSRWYHLAIFTLQTQRHWHSHRRLQWTDSEHSPFIAEWHRPNVFVGEKVRVVRRLIQRATSTVRVILSRNNSVGTVARQRTGCPRNRGSNTDRGNWIYLFSKRPDSLCGPPASLTSI